MTHILRSVSLSVAVALFSIGVAHAGGSEDVAALNGAPLEALAGKIGVLLESPAVGCVRTVRRVRATLDAGEILENHINGYLSDLEKDRGMSYDFGLLSTADGDAASVRSSFRAVDSVGTDPNVTARLDSLAAETTALLAADSSIQLKGGTAVFVKGAVEEQLTVRVIADRARNEFLLFAVGACN